MRREQIATAGIGLLAAFLVGAGLMVVGGPEQGRIERRDQQRFDTLRRYAECIAGRAVGGDTKAAATSCAAEHPTLDGDAPFRFELAGSTSFRVCATFEDPQPRASYGISFDAETGCLTRDLPK